MPGGQIGNPGSREARMLCPFVRLCLLTWEDKYFSLQNHNNLMTVSIIALSAKITVSILIYKVTHDAE
jgi:hypothetical protein